MSDCQIKKMMVNLSPEDFKAWVIEQRDNLKYEIDQLAEDPTYYAQFKAWFLTEWDLRLWNDLLNGEGFHKPCRPLSINYSNLVGKPTLNGANIVDKMVLEAGDNITIDAPVIDRENKTTKIKISSTGGGTGDVTKDYVDTQDQAVKAYTDTKYTALSTDLNAEKTRAQNAEEALTLDLGNEKTRAMAAETALGASVAGKLDLPGKEQYSQDYYNVPYHMTLTPAADKVTATAYTIALNNETDMSKKLKTWNFDLPAATTTSAGIMTATDKTALNNKVDKTTTDSQLYGTKKEGGVVVQTTIGYSNTPNPSHIVKYDNTGRVRVDNTNLDASGNENCATPVSYVKNNFATISNLTNEATLRTQGDGDLQTQITALASVARVEVVTSLPTTLVNNTIYYVGTASPYHIYLRANDTTYDLGTTEIDLSGYEKTGNKTSTISASSTALQYPTAKAVFDYGNPMNTAITNLGNNKQDKITSTSKLNPSLVNFTTDQSNALSSGITSTKVNTYDGYATKFTYQTTAPTAAISDNGIHIVYLTSEPTTKYAGYIYFIK